MLQIVCCDVDGVLADFKTAYEQMKERVFAAHISVSQVMMDDFKEAFWRTPPYEFWYGLQPMVDVEAVHKAFQGHRIIYVTNCPNATARRDWLRDHGFMKKDSLCIINPPGTLKADLLQFLEPRLFIDDDEKQITAAVEGNVPSYHIDYMDGVGKPWAEIAGILAAP